MSAPIIEPVTIDCSQWNCLNYQDHPDDTGIDFALLAARADTVIIRLSVGLQEDLRGQQIYAGLLPYAQAGKVKIAFYHGHIEWLDSHAQATFFASLCEGKLFVFVMADFERDSSGLSQLALANRYNNFLLALASELLIPVYDIVVYTALWFWDPNIGAVMQTFFSKFRLIFAHYTLNFTYLLIPSSWKYTETPWWKHQFSADGNGMGATFGFPGDDIDMNRDNPALVPPPDPDPLPEPGVKTGTAIKSVSFRAYPVVAACTFQRMTIVGERFEIVGGRDNFCGHSWWNVRDAIGVRGWQIKSGIKLD